MGELHNGLAETDHLPRLRKRRGYDAIRSRLEFGIVELVARQTARTLGTREPAFRLALRRGLAVEVGNRCVTARLQRLVTLEIRGGLVQIRGGSRKLSFGAFDLQPQVLGIEARDDVAGMDAIAHVDQARDHLAADPKTQIGLVSCADDTDKIAGRVLGLKGNALDLHRALRLWSR